MKQSLTKPSPALSLLLVLGALAAGCGCGDDDDVSADGDADGDNQPPTIAADPALPDTVRQAGLLATTLVATDPDGDPLTWTVQSPASGVELDEATGALSVRVPVDATGTIDVAVEVSDGTESATFEHSATVEPLGWEEVVPAWDPQSFTATAVDETARVAYQVGGFGQTRSAILMRHDFATESWARVALAGDPLPPLMAAGACYSASLDALIIAGGFLGHLPSEFERNHAVYEIDLSADPAVVHALGGDDTPEAVFPRLVCHPSADQALLVGTFGLEGPDMTPYRITVADGNATVEALSPATMPPARAYFGIARHGTDAIVFGGDSNPGEQSENYADAWRLSLDTGEYEPIAAGDGPAPRAYMATAIVGDTLVVAGGSSPQAGAMADVWLLDLTAPAWTEVTLGGEVVPFSTQAWAFDPELGTLHLYAPSLADPELGILTDPRDVSIDVDVVAPSAAMVFRDPAAGQGPRRRFGALVGVGGDRSRLVVTGGSTAIVTSENALEDAWLLDLETDAPAWEPVATDGESPGPVWGATLVADDSGRTLSVGGWDGRDPTDGRVYALDADDGHWRAMDTTGDVPSQRVGACAAWNDASGTMLLFSGLPDIGDAKTWELQAGSASGTWREIDAVGPAARGFAACAIEPVSRRFVIFGGEDSAGVYNDAWALDLSDPGHETWTQIAPSGDGPGSLTDMAFCGDPAGRKLVIFGGTAGIASLGDVWMLDLRPGHETWMNVPWDATGPEVRRAAGGVYHAPTASFVVFGGRVLDPGLALLNDVWRLRL